MTKLFLPTVLAAVFLTSFSCTPSQKPVTEISMAEAEGLLRNDFGVWVDVREAGEKSGDPTPRAVALPRSVIQAQGPEWKQFLQATSKEKQILIQDTTAESARAVGSHFAREGYRVSVVSASGSGSASGTSK